MQDTPTSGIYMYSVIRFKDYFTISVGGGDENTFYTGPGSKCDFKILKFDRFE